MPKQNLILTLSKIIYFEDLSPEDLLVLMKSMMTRTFTRGQTIFHEGEIATGLCIIEEGRVKISKTNTDGNEHILHILGQDDTFNDIATLDYGENPANAIALSNVIIHIIPPASITYLIENNSQFALKVVRILAHRVRSLVREIENLALYSVIVRLARFLIKQSKEPNLSGQGITRTAIAAHLATTPQTISVVLREIEATQAIEFDRHQIIILDEEKLHNIALL